MRFVIQRVQRASVSIDGKVHSEIGPGLLTLMGVAKLDQEAVLVKALEKIVNLRIFPDTEGKMNLSLKDVGGQHLLVSQFTLLADCQKGNRPSFVNAEEPLRAKALYERALEISEKLGVSTKSGVFAADMKIELVNDGPVTIVLDF